ncbi:MAG TPA: hypothetical protein VL551_06745 [Actinospica sp.]|jgi:hypothetical protein|nr:hypothetical protein [Actinospica sp.]
MRTNAAAPIVIAAAILVTLTACQIAPEHYPCGSLPSPQPSDWAQDPAALDSYVASGMIPPYYVEANDYGADAFVRETATGKTLATIQPPPPDEQIIAATAASDDRTFVIEAERFNGATRSLYRFHLNSSGRPGLLSRLPVSLPSDATLDGIALSPNADKIAFAILSSQSSEKFAIEIDTLATGTLRTWTATDPTNILLRGETTLSWTRDERTLSFPWGVGHFDAAGTRLLNLNAPTADTNLLTASRPAPTETGHGWTCTGTPIITPDAKTLTCGAVQSPPSTAVEQVAAVAEYDAPTGKLERVVGRQQSTQLGAVLWWQNTKGTVLIGAVQGPFDSCPMALPATAGVFTANRFIALPEAVRQLGANYAW